MKIPRRAIALLTAQAFGITAKEIDVKAGRCDRLCRVRFAICLLIREFRPETSYPQIAALIGYRDHTSVIHGIREGRRLIARNQHFRECLSAAQELIMAWKPGDGPGDASVVWVPAKIAKTPERQPAAKSAAPSALAFLAQRLSRVPEKETAA